MKNDMSSSQPVNSPLGLAPIALPVAAAMLLVFLCGTASAHRNPLVGRDGKIHACYRVKGKPRGALRVVRGSRAHCRRGERKVAWTVVGAEGTAGSTGATGASGGQGQDGTQGAITTILTEQVKSLSSRIAGLEATLAGVCKQSEALTEQVNLVAEVVKGLGLNGVLTTLGGLLEIPELPKPLGTFSCPSS